MKTDPSQTLDLAVLGGGINGAGLAFLASRAGLSVGLFEKGDWAQGTSSRSTKLIHGGIRYLEQARLSLVREALGERRSLLSDAPHLVRPLPFLLPIYRGDSRPPWMLRCGLWLYDLLAGRRNLHRHSWLSPQAALKTAPGLKSEGLLGCGVYWDAQVNDARLVWENVLGARDNGAFCLNGAEVTKVETLPQGFKLIVRTAEGDRSFSARCLADATGPWANRTARLLTGREQKKVRPTRGSHIVMPRALHDYAVLVTSPREKRILFVIPWRGYSLVGTTDLDDAGDPDHVRCTREEEDYLLDHARRLFPSLPWRREEIAAAFSGLRPLAWSDDTHASSVSREDRITAEGRTVTILGGKLTTYRSMARRALALAFNVLGRSGSAPPHTRLPGAPLESWESFLARALRDWPKAFGITAAQAEHLAGLYGGRAPLVLEPLKRDPSLGEPLDPARPEIGAQVVYGALREDARHLEDVLLRRMEIGYTRAGGGVAAEKASRLMAGALHWDEPTRLQELERYFQKRNPPGDA